MRQIALSLCLATTPIMDTPLSLTHSVKNQKPEQKEEKREETICKVSPQLLQALVLATRLKVSYISDINSWKQIEITQRRPITEKDLIKTYQWYLEHKNFLLAQENPKDNEEMEKSGKIPMKVKCLDDSDIPTIMKECQEKVKVLIQDYFHRKQQA